MAKMYKTSAGTPIDIEAIRSKHSREIAAGNMPVNARGDEIGKGGKVVRKAADIYRAQHAERSTSTVKKVSIRDQTEVAPATTEKATKKKKKEVTLENGDIVIVDEVQNPEADLE